MRSVKVAMLIAALFALQGCGGGDGGDAGNSDPPAATSAEGLWSGSSSSGRSSIGLVLDDGEFWMIYMAEGNDAIIAGALQGLSTSNNGSFSSSGRDFNFEGLGVNDFTASGNYVMKKSLDGTIRYSGGTEYSFSGDYDPAYELTPRSLADIAGTYSGTAVSSAGPEFAVAEVSASGEITGSSAGGCNYTGTVEPHARGNVYDIAITFGGGVCIQGTSTVTGVAYLDAGTNRLIAAALNASRTDGFLSVGQKQ